MFTETPEEFLMNGSVAIHSISADGTIVYANQYELELLGYTHEEYVGHNTSEFQIDKDSLDDMLTKLSNFENLKNYPARIQGKHSIKYLLYNSSIFQKNGEYIHSRCYAIDVDKFIYDEFKKSANI